MRHRSAEGAVVVITGASSGLGRATARAFAQHGADLVLAARGQHSLQEVALECQRLGARAHVVAADVGEAAEMVELAGSAVEFFGGIDIWINAAGTGAVGEFLDTPMPAHEQVIRTNLLGPLHGAYAALPVFESQGHGVIINTNSVGAWSPTPYAAAYGASKAGLRALARALRAEYSGWSDIHICEIYPTFLDSPGLAHGANYTGREVKPPPGTWSPERIAEHIVWLAEHPRDSLMPGLLSKASRLADIAAPEISGAIAARGMKTYLRQAEEVPQSDGILFEPDEESTGVHGDWGRPRGSGAAAGLAVLGVAAGLALIVGAAMSRRGGGPGRR